MRSDCSRLTRRIGLACALALAGSAPADATDLLVVSGSTNQVLRFSGATGAYESVFATIRYPDGLAGDGAGHVYVSTDEGIVAKYDESGDLLDFVLATPGTGIGDIAVGPDGAVYGTVFFQDRVVRIDFGAAPPTVSDFVPSGSGGLDGPEGLVFGGPDGELYVSSRINGEILLYDHVYGSFLTIYATPGGNGPQRLTFGPDGDLYVANDGTDTVLRYDPNVQNGFVGTFATPSAGSSDGMTPAFGPDGNLYVSLTVFANRVERFDGTTGASLGTFVAEGSHGLAFASDLVFVPDAGSTPAGVAAALALAAVRARRGHAGPRVPSDRERKRRPA